MATKIYVYGDPKSDVTTNLTPLKKVVLTGSVQTLGLTSDDKTSPTGMTCGVGYVWKEGSTTLNPTTGYHTIKLGANIIGTYEESKFALTLRCICGPHSEVE